MAELERIRETADYLLDEGKYEMAFVIYTELCDQVWNAIGYAQSGMMDFSRSYLSGNFRTSVDFNNIYTEQAVSSIFINWFSLDFEQIQIEFIFSLYGKIQCVGSSAALRNKIKYADVLNDYLVLFILVIHHGDPRWLKNILRVATPVIKTNKLTRVRNNLNEHKLEETILEYSPELKTTQWAFLNNILQDYLIGSGNGKSSFYSKISKESDKSYRKSDGRKKDYKKDEKKEYQHYEKYERYERYEKYEKSYTGYDNIDISGLTDDEKARYFGDILKLKGKVTKTMIRQKYIELIAQYHPDKVDGLGPELKELANRKTQEINTAYQWMKTKYEI